MERGRKIGFSVNAAAAADTDADGGAHKFYRKMKKSIRVDSMSWHIRDRDRDQVPRIGQCPYLSTYWTEKLAT